MIISTFQGKSGSKPAGHNNISKHKHALWSFNSFPTLLLEMRSLYKAMASKLVHIASLCKKLSIHFKSIWDQVNLIFRYLVAVSNGN